MTRCGSADFAIEDGMKNLVRPGMLLIVGFSFIVRVPLLKSVFT
jgi:hypothetical protein